MVIDVVVGAFVLEFEVAAKILVVVVVLVTIEVVAAVAFIVSLVAWSVAFVAGAVIVVVTIAVAVALASVAIVAYTLSVHASSVKTGYQMSAPALSGICHSFTTWAKSCHISTAFPL